ncbi:hypothetical protein [Photorhabdus khanii]|uniref:Uncharacterized protein n=3 Tax=Photorhabdus khanii TaxID=1004150 RepID=A0A4R4IM14_9GAMM|nr:hypothetical protein [Photorhabdus khanii]ETS33644.1 hypothetical protein PTE_00820 [Photorhabdus khanii NC19]MQL46515.1 hypothetical protein [Photorhabdus khanii]OHV52228.1 hypothetical protein BB987_14860 [Photorhabdus temperata]TDB41261.1 hypothetical protein C5467_24545 [Photorhabdus khanii subsp. guanajuatensis]
MTNDELRKNLKYLIDKYILSDEDKKELYVYLSREDIPVKGILADFNKYKIRTVDQADGDLIKDIYFHYC